MSVNVVSSEIYEICFDSGITGLVGTVSVMLIDNDGGEAVAASTAGIVESPAGSGIYCANRTAPAATGHYSAIWSSDGTYDPPSVGIEDVFVYASVASLPSLPSPVGGGSALGPCSAWTTSELVGLCCSVETTDDLIFDDAVVQASELLFELSGRLFAGECEKTVVACEDSSCMCGIQVLSRGYVVGASDMYGNWAWPCGCPSRVKLSGYPVREIGEVKIGGIVLDPSEYELRDSRYLVRLGGENWPSCDVICRNETEDENTITYTYGQNPSSLGQQAAAQLACEIYKGCTGGVCALPTGTTRITRQGITIERLAFATWAFRDGTWRTGIPLVDAFLGAYARYGGSRRPSVWSASSRLRYARPVGS